MSYSCSFSFKEIPQSKIMSFLSDFKKEFKSHLKDVADEIFIMCPKLQEYPEVPESFAQFSVKDKLDARYWFSSVLKYKFFYNEELGLLGISGVPQCMEHLFDGTVYFQNHTDQDYQKELYGNIKPFLDIYFKWHNIARDAAVKDEFAKRRSEDFDKEYAGLDETGKCNMINYYRRTFCYEDIWEHFSSNLWNDEDQIYFSIFRNSDNELMQLFKYCYDAHVKFNKNNN